MTIRALTFADLEVGERFTLKQDGPVYEKRNDNQADRVPAQSRPHAMAPSQIVTREDSHATQ